MGELALQQWRGYVGIYETGDSEFQCVISDLTCPENPDELITFLVSQIPEKEQKFLAKGATFKLNVIKESENEAILYLEFDKELPFSEEQIEESFKEADKTTKILDEVDEYGLKPGQCWECGRIGYCNCWG